MSDALTLPPADLLVSERAGGARLDIVGDWEIDTVARLAPRVDEAAARITGGEVSIDLRNAGSIDTSGAWLIQRLAARLEASGARVTLAGASPGTRRLLEAVSAEAAIRDVEARARRGNPGFLFLDWVGRLVAGFGTDLLRWIAILGAVVKSVGRGIVTPRRLRVTSIVHHLEATAFRAVPIMLVMGFLLGVIVAQQGAFQFRQFVGPELVVVDLTGFLMLREIGILLAAIMLAGRSGSAFTAELGAMKMREEVDALTVIGVDPYEVLVTPRVIALVIALPLLTLLVDLAGLVGGAVLCRFYLDMPFEVYIDRLQTVGLNTLFSGLIKAPFMALFVAIVACSEGLKVGGSTESLGRHTTSAVVKGIFVVVFIDGVFAIFFAAIGY